MKEFDCISAQALWGDLSRTLAAPLLRGQKHPWECLALLGDFIVQLGNILPAEEYDLRGEHIWIAKTAKLAPSVTLTGPCIIGPGTQLRPGAFIRGNVLVGADAVVGNSTELKNCILFDGVQVPHFNYVGDSILGYRAHMGAGAVTSNIKNDKTDVTIRIGDARAETGLRKLGALLGDGVEVGCNSVLNPGTVIGPGTAVYPLSSVRGYVPGGCIYKNAETITVKQK